MGDRYQRRQGKSTRKFQVVAGPFGSAQGKRELAPMKSGLAVRPYGRPYGRVPLPLVEMWEGVAGGSRAADGHRGAGAALAARHGVAIE